MGEDRDIARVRFGAFEIQPSERRLLHAGQPLAVGPRAFNLLVVLMERAGQLVSKDELLDRVWPNLVVEENNLQVQVSALRKILGAQAIATIAGHGYRFGAGVERQAGRWRRRRGERARTRARTTPPAGAWVGGLKQPRAGRGQGPAGAHAAADAGRIWRHRQDAAVASGRGRRCGRLSGRGVVGGVGAANRCPAGGAGGGLGAGGPRRAGAAGGRGSAEARRGTTSAAPPRQLRTSDPSRCGTHQATAASWPAAEAPRHQPGTAAPHGRDDLRGAGAYAAGAESGHHATCADRVRGGAAVPRPRGGSAAGVSTDASQCRRGGGHLSSRRRHSAGDRAGRCARARTVSGEDRRAALRPLPAASAATRGAAARQALQGDDELER